MSRLEAIAALVSGTPTQECVDVIKKSGGLNFVDGDENLEGEVSDRWEQLTDENRRATFVAQFSTTEPERFRHMHDFCRATSTVVTPVITLETLAAAAPGIDEPVDLAAPVVRAGMPARAAARPAPAMRGFGGGANDEEPDATRRDRDDRSDRNVKNQDGQDRGSSQLEALQRNIQPTIDAARAGNAAALTMLKNTISRLEVALEAAPDRTQQLYLEFLYAALPLPPVTAHVPSVENAALAAMCKKAWALRERAIVGDKSAYTEFIDLKNTVSTKLAKKYDEELQAFFLWLATNEPPNPAAAAKKQAAEKKAAEDAQKKRLEEEAKATAAAEKKAREEAEKKKAENEGKKGSGKTSEDRDDRGDRNSKNRDGQDRGSSQLESLQRNMQPTVDAARAGNTAAQQTMRATIHRLRAEQEASPDRTRGAYLEWLRAALPPKPPAARAERVVDPVLTAKRAEAEGLLARAVLGDQAAYTAFVAMKEEVGAKLLVEYTEEWQAFYIWLATSAPPDPAAAEQKRLEDEAKATAAAEQKRLEDEAKATAAAEKKRLEDEAKAEEAKKLKAKAKGIFAVLKAHPFISVLVTSMLLMALCCGCLSLSTPEKKTLKPPAPVMKTEQTVAPAAEPAVTPPAPPTSE